MKYKALGNYAVTCNGRIIAMSYSSNDGYFAKILQGMPRDETVSKIINDCPDFAKANNMSNDKQVMLFGQMKHEKSMIKQIKFLLL